MKDCDMSEEKCLNRPPRVSVCITTFNQINYILPAVMSVLAQVGQGADFELEVLVGDDSSTDGSSEVLLEMAARYPGVLNYHRHPVNLGANDNFKYLVRQATGDFIAHLDGDDYWLPEKLKFQLARMNEDARLIACYSNAFVLDPAGQCVGVFTGKHSRVIDFDYLASRGNFLNFSTLLYRASQKEMMLALNKPMIDYEVHMKLAQVGPLGFIEQPHACYRWMSTTSMLRNQFTEYDQAYLAALRRSLPSASSRVRSHAFAAYIVTTLLSRKHWLFNDQFWQEVGALRSSLSVSRIQTIHPLFSLSVSALRMKLSKSLVSFFLGGQSVAARFPRL